MVIGPGFSRGEGVAGGGGGGGKRAFRVGFLDHAIETDLRDLTIGWKKRVSDGMEYILVHPAVQGR